MAINAKTYSQKPAEVKRDWILIDAAESDTLGRLSAKIATFLTGKNILQSKTALYVPYIL